MLPDLTVLIALLLGLLQLNGAPADAVEAPIGTLLCVLIGAALSRMALARGQRALEEEEPLGAEVAARWTGMWPFLAWLACLLAFDWGAWVNAYVPRTWWLGRYVALLLPAAVGFAVGWVGRARLEAGIIARRGGVPLPSTPAVAIRRGLRRNALALLPLFLVLGVVDGVWVLGELGVEPLRRASLWSEAMPLLEIGLMLVLVVLSLPFLPHIFVKALKARPLEPGRLREVLERAARAIGLRYRDIMLWRTGGRVFNAMVVGFTPRTRTIFLTDGLINALPEDEVLAVFFHEAGHAKRHHLPLLILCFFALSLVFYGLYDTLRDWGISDVMQIALHLAVLWFGLLGWVSRRFERESDIYGAEHASDLEPDAPPLVVPGLRMPLPRGAALMMRALERIKTVVGTGYSHRHGSVDDRMAYIAAHATDPEVRAGFWRTRRSILVGIAGVVVLGGVLTAARLPSEIAHAHAHVASSDAMDAYEEAWYLAHSRDLGDRARALPRYREAYEGFRRAAARLEGRADQASAVARIHYLFNAADTAMHGLRDREAAAAGFAQVLELLDEAQLDGPAAAVRRFECHVALGRLAAWHDAALAPGHPDRTFEQARGHIEKAQEIRVLFLGAPDVFDEDRRAYFGERLRLLEATYDGARGELLEARRQLEKLAQLGGGAPDWDRRDMLEVAEDARLELERLAAGR